MYSTCLFCTQTLGRNEALEHFPIGRRLAFDAAKGRLWVVCRKCERCAPDAWPKLLQGDHAQVEWLAALDARSR